MQPLRDLDQVRSFLASGGPTALFDLPWMPIYLGICFLFHFWIGVTALFGALVLVAITILTETRTRGPAKAYCRFCGIASCTGRRGQAKCRGAAGHGHAPAAASALAENPIDKYLAAQEAASDVASGLGGISKAFRSILQSLVLAVGAFLVINQESTAGIIIAGSILTARALAPVELAIANWKGFVGARQSGRRLDQLLKLLPRRRGATGAASADQGSHGRSAPRHGTEFGEADSQRCFVQAAERTRGLGSSVRADPANRRWRGRWWASGRSFAAGSSSTMRRSIIGLRKLSASHIGYLPQDVELFDGSIAINIARFDPKATPDAVLEAARVAGAHDLILSFADGYGTKIGEGGMKLSAGQRQRIGLARAFYGNPFLVVLDEPTSNLDSEGEEAFTEAILSVRAAAELSS